MILGRKYCETSSRENTIQEAKATSVYYVQLFLCQLCYDILFPNNDGANNINNDNVQQQPLYEIDINEGIGTIEPEEYKTIQYSID